MSHAEMCPVCGGSGKVGPGGGDTSTCPQLKDCHGCGGKGWIEVGNDNIPVLYPVPVPTPAPSPSPWQLVPYYPNLPLVTWFYAHDRGL